MKIILSIFALLTLSIAISQEEEMHHIDLEMKQCLNSNDNISTEFMTNCVVTAFDKWKKELEINYKKLHSLLPQDQKEILEKAQKQWIIYRDMEENFSSELYYKLEGTMWIPVNAHKKLELTKQRAIQLKGYIIDFTIDKE